MSLRRACSRWAKGSRVEPLEIEQDGCEGSSDCFGSEQFGIVAPFSKNSTMAASITTAVSSSTKLLATAASRELTTRRSDLIMGRRRLRFERPTTAFFRKHFFASSPSCAFLGPSEDLFRSNIAVVALYETLTKKRRKLSVNSRDRNRHAHLVHLWRGFPCR